MKKTIAGILFVMMLASFFLISAYSRESIKSSAVFSFDQRLTLPGSPQEIYDAITGDSGPWWDHSFSEKPYKLYTEAKPGGGLYEIFNENGDGEKQLKLRL